jgi:hypothetical protein
VQSASVQGIAAACQADRILAKAVAEAKSDKYPGSVWDRVWETVRGPVDRETVVSVLTVDRRAHVLGALLRLSAASTSASVEDLDDLRRMRVSVGLREGFGSCGPWEVSDVVAAA